jgi:putative membrane protein
MNLERLFPEGDRERIRATVDAAERHTSGEIVPYVVERSDHYEEAEWRCGAVLAAVAILGVVIAHNLTTVWLPVDLLWAGTAAAGGFFVGICLVRLLPPVLRFFAGGHTLDHRVAQRGAQAFLAEEVFATRDRTGILIFVSMLEHRVLVVGDTGINARVGQEAWAGVVNSALKGIRRGAPTDGLVDAIGECGKLLAGSGVAVKPDDRNELRDELRIGASRRRRTSRK